MSCPNPFDAIQASPPPFNTTWSSHCRWPAYLSSDAAFEQGGSYLRIACVVESINGTALHCHLVDDYCTSPDAVFASAPLLAMCSITPNVTLPSHGPSMNATNATINHSGGIIARNKLFNISSIVSTGLISYCTLVPGCSRSEVCSTALLLGTDGQLFRQGVVDCWQHLCNFYQATINPDFGGFGMILSYLTQLSFALINLALTVIHCLVKTYHSRKQQPTTVDKKGRKTSSSQSRSSADPLPSRSSPHLQNFLRYLSDFHKLQCYYSITLQIATLVALYGPLPTTHSIRNPFDEAFLLLVSINGILPVTIMLYTLALSSTLSLYHITLTFLSAILASNTGITIVKLLSEPYAGTEKARGSTLDWPASTGGQAPEVICGRHYTITYPAKLRPEKVFLVGAALCDALLIVMIGRCLMIAYPCMSPVRYLQKRSRRPLSSNRLLGSGKIVQWVKSAGYIAAAFVFIYCTTMEYFFFYQMLVPQYNRIVNFNDWGFGQIVGIAVWAVVIIDLARHEIALLWKTWRDLESDSLTPPLV